MLTYVDILPKYALTMPFKSETSVSTYKNVYGANTWISKDSVLYSFVRNKVDVICTLIHSYNHTRHKYIKMGQAYGCPKMHKVKTNLTVGDHYKNHKISKKLHFEKRYEQNWIYFYESWWFYE